MAHVVACCTGVTGIASPEDERVLAGLKKADENAWDHWCKNQAPATLPPWEQRCHTCGALGPEHPRCGKGFHTEGCRLWSSD